MATAAVSLATQSVPYMTTDSASPVNFASGDLSTTSYEKMRNRISTTVVSEEFLGPTPQQDNVRYVEVPVIQEVIKQIPRIETRVKEVRVPRYEYETIEKIVEVPSYEYRDVMVEKEEVREVVVHKPMKQRIERPVEKIIHITQPEIVSVEKVVEVPGPVIEVPKTQIIETKIPVTVYHDKEAAVMVAQSVRPVLLESHEMVEIDATEYEPEVITVDVQVVKGVPTPVYASGIVSEVHRVVDVPIGQYNSMLKALNSHLVTQEEFIPYRKEVHEQYVQFAPHTLQYVSPLPNVAIEGLNSHLTAYQTTTTTGHHQMTGHHLQHHLVVGESVNEGVGIMTRDISGSHNTGSLSHRHHRPSHVHGHKESIHRRHSNMAVTTGKKSNACWCSSS